MLTCLCMCVYACMCLHVYACMCVCVYLHVCVVRVLNPGCQACETHALPLSDSQAHGPYTVLNTHLSQAWNKMGKIYVLVVSFSLEEPVDSDLLCAMSKERQDFPGGRRKVLCKVILPLKLRSCHEPFGADTQGPHCPQGHTHGNTCVGTLQLSGRY